MYLAGRQEWLKKIASIAADDVILIKKQAKR